MGQRIPVIKRAGVKPWPRLWHNMRATRQTELEDQFPSHVVCAWLGNSKPIAAKHYLQVTDDHFKKATQNPTHPVHDRGVCDGLQYQGPPQMSGEGVPDNTGQLLNVNQAVGEGFEPPDGCPSPVFKTGAFDHSATRPTLEQ
jgi:hypothetical protein